MLAEFHFLRPLWLWALVPALLFLWRFYQIKQRRHFWANKVDAHLLKHLLFAESEKQSRFFVVLLALAWLTAIIALAGPTWEKLPSPALRGESALVVALDVSRSMDADDLYPSRLEVLKKQLVKYLLNKKEGSVALVLFAEEAYLASPLSSDASTALDIVKHADTRIVPVQGSRPDRGLLKSLEILEGDKREQGQVLLITDGAYDKAALRNAAKRITSKGYALAILGLGSESGGEIPGSKDRPAPENLFGLAVKPKLDESFLRRVAEDAGGIYATLEVGVQSVSPLVIEVKEQVADLKDSEKNKIQQWQEMGYWLLFLLVPLASLAFRRGWVGSLLVLSVLSGSYTLVPNYAQAAEKQTINSVWRDLWLREDYQAYRYFKESRIRKAADKFEDPMWKGGAWYREGEFRKAEQYYAKVDTAQGHFNRGNALAQQGKLKEALDAYNRTLELQLEFADASFNRQLIEEHLQEKKGRKKNKKTQKESKEKDKIHKSPKGPTRETEDGGGKNKKVLKKAQNSDEKKKQDNKKKQVRDDKKKGKSNDQKIKESDAKQIKESDAGNEKSKPSMAFTEFKQKSSIGSAQWLNMIIDSPSELLRLKFAYKYKLNPERVKESEQPW